MTIPKQVIEAGKAAIAHRRSDPSKRKYFIDDRHVETIITAALAALWQPIEEAPKDDEDKVLLTVYERYPKDLSLVVWQWNEWAGMCDGQAAHESYGAAERHNPYATHFIDPSIFPIPPTPKEG